MQQGRVQLDADHNEQLDIDEHLDRTETRDVIGLCGAPINDGGFKILKAVTNAAGDADLIISPGRIYVDGLLCELDATRVDLTAAPAGSTVEVTTLLVDGRLLDVGQWVQLSEGTTTEFAEITAISGKSLTLAPSIGTFTSAATIGRVVTYLTQPDYPAPDAYDAAKNYVAYLAVWQRHITEVEDGELREPALGGPDSGPDTTTRLKTVWQVRLEEIDPSITEPGCEDFGGGWMPAGTSGTAGLRARAEPDPEADDPCLVPPEAGYRRLEHQLYRAEIHRGSNPDGDTPTFKWSRDNGSVVYPVSGVSSAASPATLGITHLGRDEYLRIKEQDVVEVVDDSAVLLGDVNDLYRVSVVDPGNLEVTLDAGLPGQLAQVPTEHPLIRRWDHRENSGTTIAADGGIEIVEDTWLPLEAGVEVQFRPGSTYHTGDYWLIPARYGVPEGVLWPTEDTTNDGSVFQLPHGIERDYCVVAVITAGDLEDCRPTFPPLTELEQLGCCRRVEVGDDIQLAIDEAISSGGGCICLARGVHAWSGELRFHNGRNVTLHGEPGATLLLMPDEDDKSGVSIVASERIGLGDLFIAGLGVPWLVRVLSEVTGTTSSAINLERLRLLNPMPGPDERSGPWTGAILAAGVDGLTIDGCAIVATTGVLSLIAPSLPSIERSGDGGGIDLAGVRSLAMRDTHVRYFDSGVTAFSARNWSVDGCRLDAIARFEPDVSLDSVGSASPDALGQGLEVAFDFAISMPADPSAGRTAIESLMWVDSRITNSIAVGVTAIGLAAWVRSRIEGSDIRGIKRGLSAGLLATADIRENRISVEGGPGVAFCSSLRTDIDENVIRARQGIVNLAPSTALRDLVATVRLLAAVYPAPEQVDLDEDAREIITWWLLLEEGTDLAGLRGLVDAIDAAIDARDGRFTVLMVVAAVIYSTLSRTDFGIGSHGLIVDLSIDGNDINGELGISLQEMMPLGGLRVQDNRVLAEREQAIVVNAAVLGRNPELLSAVIRTLVDLVVTRLLPLLDEVVESIEDPDDRAAAARIVDEVKKLSIRLAGHVLRALETDYRLEGNNVRTPSVVIETNLYETLISGNHVTQEQSAGLEVLRDVIGKLRAHDATRDVASAIAAGEPVYAEAWVNRAISDLPRKAVADISRCAPPISGVSAEEVEFVHARPPGLVGAPTAGVNVPRLFAGPAIWAKSPGVSVVENIVIVPPDARVETWGRGGILVRGDEPIPELFVLVMLALALRVETPSGLWMTETRIADNEVIGGYGHGVTILESYLPIPSFGDQGGALSLISEIRVDGNQTRNMAGAGILIDEEANAVGVDIHSNVVRDCSFDTRFAEAGLIDSIGGIVGRNMAFAKVHANRVTGCGDVNGPPLFAIDLDRVFQLGVTDNTLVHRGGAVRDLRSLRYSFLREGAVRASLLIGSAAIADNEVSIVVAGAGIVLNGVADIREWVLSPALVLNIGLYLELFERSEQHSKAEAGDGPAASWCRANVEDNQVAQSTTELSLGVFTNNTRDLVMTGNLVRNLGGSLTPIYAAGVITEGVIGNNLADLIAIDYVGEGTVTGNRGTSGVSSPAGGAVIANNSP